jgi:hypothetical protein
VENDAFIEFSFNGIIITHYMENSANGDAAFSNCGCCMMA